MEISGSAWAECLRVWLQDVWYVMSMILQCDGQRCMDLVLTSFCCTMFEFRLGKSRMISPDSYAHFCCCCSFRYVRYGDVNFIEHIAGIRIFSVFSEIFPVWHTYKGAAIFLTFYLRESCYLRGQSRLFNYFSLFYFYSVQILVKYIHFSLYVAQIQKKCELSKCYHVDVELRRETGACEKNVQCFVLALGLVDKECHPESGNVYGKIVTIWIRELAY